MMKKPLEIFFGNKKHEGLIDYEEYIKVMEEKLQNPDYPKFDLLKLNMSRINRINKTFKPHEELKSLISQISNKQVWLVITEDWCGDSAQIIPYVYNYVKENPNIDFIIVPRDKNLEALENYYTEDNPKSIPKITAFDEDGCEIFTWGPRPKAARDLISELKSKGYSKDEFIKEVHLWYAKNKGVEVVKEFSELLKYYLEK